MNILTKDVNMENDIILLVICILCGLLLRWKYHYGGNYE